MSLVDPSGETGFPLTVMAFMPYLLARYDDPTNVCLEAAQLIAEVRYSNKELADEQRGSSKVKTGNTFNFL